MQKLMLLELTVKDDFLEVKDNTEHQILLTAKISGTDRDILANLLGDILRNHFFVWCP